MSFSQSLLEVPAVLHHKKTKYKPITDL